MPLFNFVTPATSFRKFEDRVLDHYRWLDNRTCNAEWEDLAKHRVKIMDEFVAEYWEKRAYPPPVLGTRHLSTHATPDVDDFNKRFLRFVNYNISGLEILCVKTRFWSKPIYYMRSVYDYANLALRHIQYSAYSSIPPIDRKNEIVFYENPYHHVSMDVFTEQDNTNLYGFTSDGIIRFIRDLKDVRLWKEFCVSSIVFESKFRLTETGGQSLWFTPVLGNKFKPIYGLEELKRVITYDHNRRNYNVVYGDVADRDTRTFSDLFSDFEMRKTDRFFRRELAAGRVIDSTPATSSLQEVQALKLQIDLETAKKKEPETKMQDKWDML